MSRAMMVYAMHSAAMAETMLYTPLAARSDAPRMPTPGKRRKYRNRKKR